MNCQRWNCMRKCVDQDPQYPAGIGNLSRETGVAFARLYVRGVETAIAFAVEKWAFLVQLSGAEVPSVSRWPISAAAEVSLVSQSARGCVLCAKKFALRAQKGPRSAFYGVLGELFRENASRGAAVGERCRAVGVAGMPCDYTWVRPGAPPTARPKQVARYRAKRTACPRIMRGRAAIRRIKQR